MKPLADLNVAKQPSCAGVSMRLESAEAYIRLALVSIARDQEMFYSELATSQQSENTIITAEDNS